MPNANEQAMTSKAMAADGCGRSFKQILSAARADRRQVKAAGTAQPSVLVANDRLRRQRLGFDSHAGQLPDRRAHRKNFDQARSEFDDIGLDADDFLGAERGRLALHPVEDLLARIVNEGGEIADLAFDETAKCRFDAADGAERIDRSRDEKL